MKYARREIVVPPSAPLWYVTFSDMMTLLLACFVLLLSFSTISTPQFDTATRSLSGAFGAWRGNPQTIDARENDTKERRVLHDAAREFRRTLQVEGRASLVDIEYAGKALKVVLYAEALFGADGTGLQPSSGRLLEMLSDMVAQVPGAGIEISGHSDGSSLTAPERYADNVRVSYEMAERVYRAMRTLPGNLDGHQPVLLGCGDSRPVATEGTEAGRRRNARVEVLIRTAPAPGMAS